MTSDTEQSARAAAGVLRDAATAVANHLPEGSTVAMQAVVDGHLVQCLIVTEDRDLAMMGASLMKHATSSELTEMACLKEAHQLDGGE